MKFKPLGRSVGIDLFDTADQYDKGKSEEILGAPTIGALSRMPAPATDRLEEQKAK
jgi:predicted oxidoreductase